MSATPDERGIFKHFLVRLLRDAVRIEIATIPLYLYAMYSIKQDNGGAGTQARARIGVVVHQEMLHLALTGNLLTAVDSGPKLYSRFYVPTYGTTEDTILYSRIRLHLQRCNKASLDCFLRIEAPYEPPSEYVSDESESEDEIENNDIEEKGSLRAAVFHRRLKIADTYKSIGEFYTKLEKILALSDKYISFKNSNKQFVSSDFFDDNMIQVIDQASAQKALQIIVGQGEGSVGIEDAHYQMFLDLYRRRKEWTCWPVLTDPTTETYKDNEFLFNLSQCFDATYCYLLITIERTWYTQEAVKRRLLLRNNHAIMIDMITPLAELFVTQPWGDDGENAGPAFEFYDVEAEDDVDEKARKLLEAAISHLKAAISATSDDQVKDALSAVLFSTDRVPWPFQ